MPPCGSSDPSAFDYSQTEDKEFDDLEERFQWVSLCVTELRSNVAAYMDNVEVRALQSPKTRPTNYTGTSCRHSGVKPGVRTSIL